MTQAEYDTIRKRCRGMWGSTLRGMLPAADMDDFVSNVVVAVLRGDADDTTLGNVCRSVLRDMRRAEERQASARAQVAFEASGAQLPAHVEVPYGAWGGAREGAGRPRKAAANSSWLDQ